MKTKQEQIEEITSIIDSDICDKDCPNRCPYCGGLSSREAENIYNAGYRKADEVRKETANAVADWLLYRSNLGYPEYCKEIMQNIAKQIKEKYVAEVENDERRD